ncbi:MAG: hypothetical protein ACTHZ5_11250 [Micrococcaceae bacterium]
MSILEPSRLIGWGSALLGVGVIGLFLTLEWPGGQWIFGGIAAVGAWCCIMGLATQGGRKRPRRLNRRGRQDRRNRFR